MSTRFRALTAAMLAIGLMASACTSQWTAADVSGAWEHVENGHTAILKLNADGSAEATDVPRDALLGTGPDQVDVDWSDLVSGSGTWEPDAGTIILSLQVAAGSGITSTIYVNGGGSDATLYTMLNPDEIGNFEFQRQ